MDGNFSLSSYDEGTRRFWIEHGIRCREIAVEFAKALGQPCAINYWMPDGYKDACADTKLRRDLMRESLDAIFAPDIDEELVPCGLESKLFGIGVESYTVASHEFSYGYAVKNRKLYTLDAGHFHPTEVISAKLSRLENLLKDIFSSVREHPDQMHRMHKLMDYYLPTTLKLVEAYEEFDRVKAPGEDIIKAKAEIENTLDTINQAFAELLNNL